MNGIQAAWAENRKEGELSVTGRTVQYRRHIDGMTWAWTSKSPKEASAQIKLFRAALNHPDTRPQMDAFTFNYMD
jgi:hypothetical protein